MGPLELKKARNLVRIGMLWFIGEMLPSREPDLSVSCLLRASLELLWTHFRPPRRGVQFGAEKGRNQIWD